MLKSSKRSRVSLLFVAMRLTMKGKTLEYSPQIRIVFPLKLIVVFLSEIFIFPFIGLLKMY
jgi:hypothetical protein